MCFVMNIMNSHIRNIRTGRMNRIGKVKYKVYLSVSASVYLPGNL